MGGNFFTVGISLNKNLLGRVTGNKQLFLGLIHTSIHRNSSIHFASTIA